MKMAECHELSAPGILLYDDSYFAPWTDDDLLPGVRIGQRAVLARVSNPLRINPCPSRLIWPDAREMSRQKTLSVILVRKLRRIGMNPFTKMHPRKPTTTANNPELVVGSVAIFRPKSQKTIENKGWCAL